MFTQRNIYDINQKINLVIHKRFNKIPSFLHTDQLDKIIKETQQNISLVPIKWNFPQKDFVKLNIDGFSKDNPSPCGGGGVIRGNSGNLLAVFRGYLGLNTNNMEATLALKIGVKWYTNNEIKGMLKDIQVWKIQHYNREGNKVADTLANWRLYNNESKWMYVFQQLPVKAWDKLKMDKR
ncbi:hypothetical protein HAX54_007878 [Datura stramonium]|uniref:RNase H type-1 domain-containing protein n=1 Tax=Datura stramonium TaxID=4076 RepID=A0ABS8TES6_DATST|nr:hypothetical protein [Datura stramonium]